MKFMTSFFKPNKLILEYYYMSNGLTFAILNIILQNFYRRYDITKITCAKFQGNWFIIDREIDEKHALQNYQNECGPGYSLVILKFFFVFFSGFRILNLDLCLIGILPD